MRMAFERVGSGAPLVLVHGVGHRRQAWYPVLDQLAEQREVVLVDLPGHGQSDPLVTDGRPMVDALRDAFAEFLDQQKLNRPHFAGNSLGGRVALEAGVAGHARSVTALSPAGFWRSPFALAYTRQLFATMSRLSEALAPQAPQHPPGPRPRLRLADRAPDPDRSGAGSGRLPRLPCRPAGTARDRRVGHPVHGKGRRRRPGHDRLGLARCRPAAQPGGRGARGAAGCRARAVARLRARADERRAGAGRRGDPARQLGRPAGARRAHRADRFCANRFGMMPLCMQLRTTGRTGIGRTRCLAPKLQPNRG